MAKTRIRALTASEQRDLPEVIRRVLGTGGSNTTTPYASRDGDLWIKLVDCDSIEGEAYRWQYYCELYPSPLGEPITDYPGVVLALNTYELFNTATNASGYGIVTSGATCGDITAVTFVGLPLMIKPGGVYYSEELGQMVFVFTERNDPVIHE